MLQRLFGFGCCSQPPLSGEDMYTPRSPLLQHPVVRNTLRRNEEPPSWINDSPIRSCLSCHCTFDYFVRKHHCRSCGMYYIPFFTLSILSYLKH